MLLRNWEYNSSYSRIREFELSTSLTVQTLKNSNAHFCAILVPIFYKLSFKTAELLEIKQQGKNI